MPNLTSVLEGGLKNTKEALGVAVIDMQSGLLISSAHKVSYFTDTFLDAIAAASVEMFRGKAISTVEKIMTGLRGSLVRDMIKEAQITTDATMHFMATSTATPNLLVVLITTRRANVENGWAAVRGILAEAAPFCP